MISQYLPPKIIKIRQHFKINYASTKHIPPSTHIQFPNKHHNSTEVNTERNTDRALPHFYNKKPSVIKNRSLRNTISRINIDDNKQNIKPLNIATQDIYSQSNKQQQSEEIKKKQMGQTLLIGNKMKAIRKYQKGIKQQTKDILCKKQWKIIDFEKIILKNNRVINEISKLTQIQSILPSIISIINDFGYVYENISKKLFASIHELRQKLQKNPYLKITQLEKQLQQLANKYNTLQSEQHLIRKNQLPQKSVQTIAKINFYKITEQTENLIDFTFSNNKIQDTFNATLQQYIRENYPLDICFIVRIFLTKKQFKNSDEIYNFVSRLDNKDSLSMTSHIIIEHLQISSRTGNMRQRQILLEMMRQIFKKVKQREINLYDLMSQLRMIDWKYINEWKKNQLIVKLLKNTIQQKHLVGIFLHFYIDTLQKNYQNLITKLKNHTHITQQTLKFYHHLKSSNSLTQHLIQQNQSLYKNINIDLSTSLILCFYFIYNQIQAMKTFLKIRVKNDQTIAQQIIQPKYKLQFTEQSKQRIAIWSKKIELCKKISQASYKGNQLDYFQQIYKNIILEMVCKSYRKKIQNFMMINQ